MTQKLVLHPSGTRKFEDFGFMTAHLSFKPELQQDRQRFGPLITIDDGVLMPDAKGFGYHRHKNVEVVTFMVDGEVNHHDPDVNGHNGTLRAKGIQVITAGTGIIHNETNQSELEPMRALQIWFEPRAMNLAPNYAKRHLDPVDYTNRLQLVLSPDGDEGSLIVQQDTHLHYGLFDRECDLEFVPAKQENGVYIFMINGTAHVAGEVLREGDALGVVEPDALMIKAKAGAELLVFELENIQTR